MARSPYDADFYHYTNRVSRLSAEVVVPKVLEMLPITSVADFGCGQGVWLNVWQNAGVEDIAGIDGDYVDRAALCIPPEHFRSANLNEPIDLERRFDLVQSLEVAEHLRAENAERFVHSLTRHGDMVLFSAAPPGQGGEHHINEQPYDYWRAFFSKCGYVAHDCLRPELTNASDVAFWYRYNMILYVHESRLNDLPERIRQHRIPDDRPIEDISPTAFKLRKAVVRALPYWLQNQLAKIKSVSA